MTLPAARTPAQRKQDTLDRLERDVDAWVATADPASADPYMVPLSFLWDGTTLLIATPATSPTGRNLRANGRVRVGVGLTRDVVLIEGRLEAALTADEISQELGDAFAAKAGFDPRELNDYRYFRIVPEQVQAWREVNELPGRTLMRGGRWLAGDRAGTA